MVILDREDAVPDDRKEDALWKAVAAVAEGFGGRLCSVRINVEGAPTHGRAMAAMKGSAADHVVLTKVENARTVKEVFKVCLTLVTAMIVTQADRLYVTELVIAYCSRWTPNK